MLQHEMPRVYLSRDVATIYTIIAAAIAQWRSRLNACVRLNSGHFEHKF